jgi:hypothetical protein
MTFSSLMKQKGVNGTFATKRFQWQNPNAHYWQALSILVKRKHYKREMAGLFKEHS